MLHLLISLLQSVCKCRRRTLWIILVCMVIQWNIVLHLTSLTFVAAETWREKSQSFSPVNFTVVTAMFDIGRDDWESEYARPYSHYLNFLQRVMNLRVNIIAFADSVAAAAIRRLRHGRLQRMTFVVEMQVQDLPYFQLKDRFQRIMASEGYRNNNLLASMRHPEANVPEYDVLMLSKAHFILEAMRLDPFNSSYFIWLDGGYGHGQDIFPEDGMWKPYNLFSHSDKVTLVELGPGWVQQARAHSHRLHRVRGSLILGGFFGGGKKALQRLYRLERDVVREWMERSIVDDDQTCRVMAYYKDPSLFRLVLGDWWDVFKLFNDSVV